MQLTVIRLKRICRMLLVALIFGISFTYANPSNNKVYSNYLSNVKLVGEARFTYGIWDIYDAKLFAENGKWKKNSPYALTIHCLRNLDPRDIAENMIEEIQKQGYNNKTKLSKWYKKIYRILGQKELNTKTRLTSIHDKNGHTLFYLNDKLAGSIKDKNFSQKFFNIWLGKNTTMPYVRSGLLGLAN